MSSIPGQNFSGLSNQGATCYMNSLLQSLFMTPELRKNIYEWVYDRSRHAEKQNSIPYQLQLLFAKLQFWKKPYIETRNLTTSFGWDTKESFQQHDVQEFCRVLFEAIELSVKYTDSENLISSLYEGFMTDYVKCLTCQTKSQRSDSFLDLSLTVRNDFEKIQNDSIEKALLNYIKPELLSGSNQYMCNVCMKKVDALKGLTINKFPYILVIQIKRFDLNYQTFQRVKLNDRVTFPMILNCNKFLGDFRDTELEQVDQLDEEKPAQLPVFSFSQPENLSLRPLNTTGYELLSEDKDKKNILPDAVVRNRILTEQTDKRKKQQEELIKRYQKDGDNVYELFSIMIHSGSALGGHYFAYIKCFENAKWYNFNDSSVKEIEDKEISKVFGGDGTGTANAYLLMYRKICKENLNIITDDEIPLNLIEELHSQAEEEVKEASLKEEKSKTINFKVNYNKKERSFVTHRDKLLKEFKLEVMNAFEISEKETNVRLRSFNSVYEVLQETFDEEKKISASQIWDYKVFGVEVKKDSEEWTPYNPNNIALKVFVWNDDINEISQPEPVVFHIDKTVSGKVLIDSLSQRFLIPAESMLLLKKVFSNISASCEIISNKNLDQSLSSLKVYENSNIYIEMKTGKPKWQSFIEMESRRYTIRFNNPNDAALQSQKECKYLVMIDQQSRLSDLKRLISQKISVPESGFLMKRGTSQGLEIKDLSLKLTEANIMNNSLIIIEKGTPSSINEFRLSFSLAGKPKPNTNKALCHSFLSLFEIPIDSTQTILEIKQQLCQKLTEMYPSFILDPHKVRLRERNNERLTRCLNNSDSLNSYHLFERKQLSLEITQNASPEPGNSLIVMGKRWNPATWEISDGEEFIINKSATIGDLGSAFASYYYIEPEKLQVTKLLYSASFSPVDLLTEIFVKPCGQSNLITASPWHVSMDGVVFFIKSSEEVARELTQEEKIKYERTYKIPLNDPQDPVKHLPYKEQGLKIKVTKGEFVDPTSHQEDKQIQDYYS